MSEKPILFSTSMVQAILDGRKTQTRRVLKSQPIQLADGSPAYSMTHKGDNYRASARRGFKEFIKLSPLKIGDILWVKETHHLNHTGEIVTYRADYNYNPFSFDQCGEDCSMVGEKWIPSIFMPKRIARIWLEVTNVKLERLQDISPQDAIAEGLIELPATGRYVINKGDQYFGNAFYSPVSCYWYLWNSINNKDEEKSWEANPYVWVYEFKRRNPI